MRIRCMRGLITLESIMKREINPQGVAWGLNGGEGVVC